MDEVRRYFEEYVEDVRNYLRAGTIAGTDDDRSVTEAEDLIDEYRLKLSVEESPTRGRELIERFRREIERL